MDSEGRINLPDRLRKYVSPENNDTFVITRGFEKCLFVFPIDEWNKLEQNLRNLSAYDPQHRRFIRAMLELASECQLDNQARISIPPELREYAGIHSEVRIIGVLDKIELWETGAYEEYKKSQGESYEEIASKVMK